MRDPEMAFSTRAVLFTKVTECVHSMPVPLASIWKQLLALKLVDTKFSIPGAVDILLVAEVFEKFMQSGRVTGARGVLQPWKPY
jgi:hypothetical protein